MSPSPDGDDGRGQRVRRTEEAIRALRIALQATLALALLQGLWEIWLAPLRPGGSWLVVKALPLLALWWAAARGDPRPRQWLAFALLPYAAEGLVRAVTESGRHALVAGLAAVLAVAAFGALLVHFRALRPR